MTKQPHEIYSQFKPRKGDPITYDGRVTGHVIRTEGNLCWNDYHGEQDPLPFIWCFKDGLNALHEWPRKDVTLEAYCPGKHQPEKR